MPKERGFVVSRAKKVEGMLTDNEAFFLYLLAKKGPGKGAIVEIGSYKGKSTFCLALGAKKGRREKVFAVDWHKGWKNAVAGGTFGEFSRNMKKFGVNGYVVPIVMKSGDAAKKWKKRIRLLWIDGSHDYKDVRNDFLLWGRYLVDGGVVAFHDSFWDGPSKVIRDYVIKSGKFSAIGMVDYITFAVKRKPDRSESAKNFLFLLMKTFLEPIKKTEQFQPMFFRRAIEKIFLRDFKKLGLI